MASVRSLVVLGAVCSLFAALLLAGPLLRLGAASRLVALVVVGAALLAVGRKYWRDREDEREQSVWDLVPSWQYAGRHVESGGPTRDGQERALEDAQDQASRFERD